jgi:hypothetical protein
MGSFPMLTQLCDCEILYDNGEKRVEFEQWMSFGDEKLEKSGEMRVRLLVHSKETDKVLVADDRNKESEEKVARTKAAAQLTTVKVQSGEHEDGSGDGEQVVGVDVEIVPQMSLDENGDAGDGLRGSKIPKS